MQRETRSLIWGIILVAIGFIFLGNNLDWFYLDWEKLWPLVIIGGGVLFWIGWLANRKEFGLLMPGTILLVYGLMFEFSTVNGWYNMDDLWPGFLLGPGLGFFFMYLLGNREKGLLIPAFILIVLSILFWMGHESFRFVWPILLIVIGVYILIKNRFRSATIAEESNKIEEEKES